MPNLIHSSILLNREFALGVHCVLFEEKADFVTRGQEIVVTDMVIVSCRELGLGEYETHLSVLEERVYHRVGIWIKLIQEHLGALKELIRFNL